MPRAETAGDIAAFASCLGDLAGPRLSKTAHLDHRIQAIAGTFALKVLQMRVSHPLETLQHSLRWGPKTLHWDTTNPRHHIERSGRPS